MAGRSGQTPWVVRYHTDGTDFWVARGEISLYQQDQAVAVNAVGESYLGTSVSRNGEADYFLRKLDRFGGVLWTRSFDTGGWDTFAALALDQAGNVLVAGWSYGSVDVTVDAVVFKYAPDGTRLWSTNFTGVVTDEGVEEFYARSLVVDRNNQAFVVVSVENDDDDEIGTVLARIDPAGRLLRITREPDLIVTRRTRLAVDASGNAYVTGTTFHPPTYNDVATVKYDPSGNRLWRVDYAAPGLSRDSGSAVAVDSRGDVHVTGIVC